MWSLRGTWETCRSGMCLNKELVRYRESSYAVRMRVWRYVVYLYSDGRPRKLHNCSNVPLVSNAWNTLVHTYKGWQKNEMTGNKRANYANEILRLWNELPFLMARSRTYICFMFLKSCSCLHGMTKVISFTYIRTEFKWNLFISLRNCRWQKKIGFSRAFFSVHCP